MSEMIIPIIFFKEFLKNEKKNFILKIRKNTCQRCLC